MLSRYVWSSTIVLFIHWVPRIFLRLLYEFNLNSGVLHGYESVQLFLAKLNLYDLIMHEFIWMECFWLILYEPILCAYILIMIYSLWLSMQHWIMEIDDNNMLLGILDMNPCFVCMIYYETKPWWIKHFVNLKDTFE